MTDFIIAIICLVLALLIIILRKAYFALPLRELKRQAAARDKFAQTIYPIVSYQTTFRALLWLLLGLFSAIAIVLLARLAPVWIGVCLVVGWLWLSFSWLPNGSKSSLGRELAIGAAPAFGWFLHYAYPVVKELGKIARFYKAEPHTGLYEASDLHDLILRQELQGDNRISKTQLGRLRKLLAFEEATVDKYQVPWQNVMKLAADDPVGPKLLDEMHQSGQNAFPVTKTKSSKVPIGILYKDDVGLETSGKVADHMRKSIGRLKSDESMESALAKFSLSGQVMFIVMNKAEEIVGVLTLKDALGSLLAPESRNTAPKEVKEDQSTELELETGGIHESAQ